MKYFLLISFIFISLFNNVSAQDEKKSGGIAIKVSPLELLGIRTPNNKNFAFAQGNLEIQLNQKWSLNPEFGIKVPSLNPAPDTFFFNNYSGYRFRFEVRKYLLPVNEGKAYSRAYISASLIYSSNKYNVNSQYIADTLPVIIGNYEFGVSQKFYGIDSRFGLQMVFFYRLLIDCYAGIGIRYKKIENFGRFRKSRFYEPGPKDKSIYAPDNDLEENSGFGIIFPLGIKIGYIITKNRFR
jgi:hypothetical protein